jgi:hypothetical protein
LAKFVAIPPVEMIPHRSGLVMMDCCAVDERCRQSSGTLTMHSEDGSIYKVKSQDGRSRIQGELEIRCNRLPPASCSPAQFGPELGIFGMSFHREPAECGGRSGAAYVAD